MQKQSPKKQVSEKREARKWEKIEEKTWLKSEKESRKRKIREEKTKSLERSPFRSFHRTYTEEYKDGFEPPKLLVHAVRTYGILFKNRRVFGGLLISVVIFTTIFIGLFSQSKINDIMAGLATNEQAENFANLGNVARATVQLVSTIATGGISQSLTNDQSTTLGLIFIVVWLVTIYLLRRILDGKKVTLRQGLYNALSPLISTLLVLIVVLLQLIPIFLLVIFYSAAIQTDFLSTPFYALLFLVFAALMILLSGYMISSSIIALVATTAPGIYPRSALRAASDLMLHRRIRFIFRLILLVFILILNCAIIMLPVILIDNALKQSFDWMADIPVTSFFMLLITIFNFIYSSAYIYLYYKEILNYESSRS